MSWQNAFPPPRAFLCQGRPGPLWAPHLHPYFCSALQVSFARDASADRAPTTYQLPSHASSSNAAQLQPVTSALCACASCLCLSVHVCLANPAFVAATSRHRLQDCFYLSAFRCIEQSCQLPVSVSALMLITRDRQTYPRIQHLQQQLSTVSAAVLPSQLTFFCVLADL